MSVSPGIYKHYKGNLYEVLSLAVHSETLEMMVVYKPLYKSPDFPDGTLWVRPLSMFEETVVVNGLKMPRFERIEGHGVD